jgi:hypothetical protein
MNLVDGGCLLGGIHLGSVTLVIGQVSYTVIRTGTVTASKAEINDFLSYNCNMAVNQAAVVASHAAAAAKQFAVVLKG